MKNLLKYAFLASIMVNGGMATNQLQVIKFEPMTAEQLSEAGISLHCFCCPKQEQEAIELLNKEYDVHVLGGETNCLSFPKPEEQGAIDDIRVSGVERQIEIKIQVARKRNKLICFSY